MLLMNVKLSYAFFIKVDLLLNTVTLHRTSSVTSIVLLMTLQIQ